MATRIPDLFPHLKSITWNYSESGHGENAADGVGGILKRITDKAVAQGKDINNFEKFIEELQLTVDKIYILPTEERSILEENQFLQQNVSRIQPLKGTMSVHQGCWSREKEERMMFRTLSCFSCGSGDKCNHYHLLKKNVLTKRNTQTLEELPIKYKENLHPTRSLTRLKYEDVYGSDDSLESDEDGSCLKIGGWVVVNYEGIKYPGEVVGMDNEGAEVKVMYSSGGRKYKWPSREDKLKYKFSDVVKAIEPPSCNSRSSFHF